MDLFTLSCAALSGRPRVLAFRGREELGQCFDYEICFTLDDEASLDLDPKQVIGVRATLTLGEHATQIAGNVAELELLEDVPSAVFRLRLVPPLEFLRHSAHHRVFVGESIPDILRKVLEQAGVASSSFELRLSREYPTRDHVCQYRESDLDFLQRWMEREGLYFYFDHDGMNSKLVLCDAMWHHEPIRKEGIPYHPVASADATSGEHFYVFRASLAAVPSEVAEADYNYLTPDTPIHAAEAVASEFATHFESWGENEGDQASAKRIAKLRAEREICRQRRFIAGGRALGVHSGFTFRVGRHPIHDLNREYLAVRVVLLGQRSEWRERRVPFFTPVESAHLGGEVTHLEVEAIASDVQFRAARRTPWPRAGGLEHGIVDGPAGDDYAQLDEHGRYLVKLMMDENTAPAGGASMRVRMLQPHGGATEGWHLPLRKGTEVLLAFIGGDPDRPIIAAAVPNAHTPSPVTRANSTLNVIQTGGRSRVEMEDAGGKQYIDISTPPQRSYLHLGAHAGLGDHNAVLSTDGDGLVHTGGNRDITIGGDQNEDVTGSLTESYHANQTTHVASAFRETLDAGATQTIHAGSTQTITGGSTQTIDGGEQRTVSGGTTETINGARTQTINGSTAESISATQTQTVGAGVTISSGGKYTVKADGSIALQTAGVMNMMSNSWLMNAPGGQLTVDDNKVTFAGIKVKSYNLLCQPNFIAIVGLAASMGVVGMRRDIVAKKIEMVGLVIQNKGVELEMAAIGKYQIAASILCGFLTFL